MEADRTGLQAPGFRLRGRCASYGLSLAFGLVLLLVTQAAQATDRCAGCHIRLPDDRLQKPAMLLRESPHRDDAIGCSACHGGDRNDPTIRAHSAAGFNRRPARADIPRLCGSCHADPRFIRRFNPALQVDQLVAYEASVHGERFRSGDTQAPVCTSCHGVHDIMGRADPRSRVHPSQVADTCKSCHADPKMMSVYKLPTHQHASWKDSVHGQGIARGNLGAATCVDCHTAHAATPPAVTSVARVCGRCHADQRERFRTSPHARAFERLGFPECEQCHGNHGVARTSPSMIGLGPDGVCGKCHEEGQKGTDGVKTLAAMIQDSHKKAAAARAAVQQAELAGLPLADARAGLEQVHTAELRLGNALHDFDPKKLKVATDEVASAAERVHASLAQANSGRRSYGRFVVVVAGLVLLHLAFLLLRIRRLGTSEAETST